MYLLTRASQAPLLYTWEWLLENIYTQVQVQKLLLEKAIYYSYWFPILKPESAARMLVYVLPFACQEFTPNSAVVLAVFLTVDR